MFIDLIKDGVFKLRLPIESIKASSNQDELREAILYFDAASPDLVGILSYYSIDDLCIELLGLKSSVRDLLLSKEPSDVVTLLKKSVTRISSFSKVAHGVSHKVNGIEAIKYNTRFIDESLDFIESFADNWHDVCLMHLAHYGVTGERLEYDIESSELGEFLSGSTGLL